jgi:hypothetical protein
VPRQYQRRDRDKASQGIAIPFGRLQYLWNIGGVFFGNTMLMNIAFDFFRMLGIIHKSRVEILR